MKVICLSVGINGKWHLDRTSHCGLEFCIPIVIIMPLGSICGRNINSEGEGDRHIECVGIVF